MIRCVDIFNHYCYVRTPIIQTPYVLSKHDIHTRPKTRSIPSPTWIGGQDGDLELSLERWKSLWRCTGFLRFSCSFSVPRLCETPSSNMSLDKAIESIARVQMETPCLLIWRIDGKPSSVKPGSRRGMSKKIRTKGKHKKKNDVGTSTKKKVIR